MSAAPAAGGAAAACNAAPEACGGAVAVLGLVGISVALYMMLHRVKQGYVS